MLDERAERELNYLLEGARGGDRASMGELYRLFGRKVLGLASYLLDQAELARDATSEVFLRLDRTLSGFDGRIPFEKWLMRVTANLCIDWLRRRRREKRLFAADCDVEAAAIDENPLEGLLTTERSEAVRKAIRGLADRYRVPLVLRYYGELSYAEIADRLGITQDQAGVLLHRAKRELRRRLEGEIR